MLFQTGSKQVLPKENGWRTERNVAKSFATKEWRKNENIKNITRNGLLPNTNRFTKQLIKTGEQFKKSATEEGENRKILTRKTDELKRSSVVNYASRPNPTVRRTRTGDENRNQSWEDAKDP